MENLLKKKLAELRFIGVDYANQIKNINGKLDYLFGKLKEDSVILRLQCPKEKDESDELYIVGSSPYGEIGTLYPQNYFHLEVEPAVIKVPVINASSVSFPDWRPFEKVLGSVRGEKILSKPPLFNKPSFGNLTSHFSIMGILPSDNLAVDNDIPKHVREAYGVLCAAYA
jgi:hypothetical protein